jgi:prepilin-type processing-associated H-X9-DG protein/prepilin-type N-terminal cleavage/methylation domain-containing protein
MSSSRGGSTRLRQGLTLVELLIVIGIIGLLAALLLPAVQSAREGGRTTQCKSNLKQLSLGMHGFESTHKTLPPGTSMRGGVFVSLLPFIEQQSLFDQIDPSLPTGPRWDKVQGIAIAIYQCPSDGAPTQWVVENEPACGTNYAGNVGTWYPLARFDGIFRYDGNWPSAAGPPFRMSEMVRGTSHTAAFADSLRADGSTARKRVLWHYPLRFTAAQIDEFCQACVNLPADPSFHGWRGDLYSRGTPWTKPTVMETLYNHVVPPNSPSCVHGGDPLSGAASSSSDHPGSVNVVFLDGHVENIQNGIELSVWRDFAKR